MQSLLTGLAACRRALTAEAVPPGGRVVALAFRGRANTEMASLDARHAARGVGKALGSRCRPSPPHFGTLAGAGGSEIGPPAGRATLINKGRGTTSARCPCGSFSDAALPNPA